MKAACVADLREAARRRLPRVLFNYIDGGANAESTLAANEADLRGVILRQRVLRDVSSLNLGSELFGQPLSMPVILAPVGLAGLYARRGEAAAARAARAAEVPFVLSTMAVCSIEEVARAATPPWLQLYMIRDRGFMETMLANARAAGAPVLVFTVDLPTQGARHRDVRSGMTDTGLVAGLRRAGDGLAHPGWLWDVWLGGRPHALAGLAGAESDLRRLEDFWRWVGRNFDPSVTWDDIAWVRARWPGPLVIKGVLDVEDARRAVDCGADGVVVSNHGGRQLDGVASSISVLPKIAAAVGDRTAVLMDGGVRSGLDVLRALALGARACLVGRAWAWGLGAGGEAGVAHMLGILRGELRTAMALTGCTDVGAADGRLLWPPSGGRDDQALV